MTKNDNFIVPKLTNTEKTYKKIYEQYPEAELNHAKSTQEIQQLVPELRELLSILELLNILPPLDSKYPTNTLHERYFPAEADVLVIPSLRYAPAFLHSHSFFEVICVLSGECDNFFLPIHSI